MNIFLEMLSLSDKKLPIKEQDFRAISKKFLGLHYVTGKL